MLPRAREQATYSLLRDDGGSAASFCWMRRIQWLAPITMQTS